MKLERNICPGEKSYFGLYDVLDVQDFGRVLLSS